MANRFSVQPLGGLQNVQMIGQGMAGIAENVQQDRAEEQRQQIMQEATEVMQRGNPQEIAQFSMRNPEIGESVMRGIQFANDATKSNLRDSMQRIIAGEDPAQVIQERAAMVEAQGGDPSDTLRELERVQQDPEGYRQQVEGIYAMSFPEEYEAFRAAFGAGGGPEIGKYNPRDYTADSFARFIETNDPSVLERYAAQRSVDIGGVPHVFDPAIGGYRPAVVSGGAKAERPRPVATEDVARSEAEIAAERERQVTRARGEEQAQSPEAQAERQQAIRQSEDTLRVVDQLLEADLGAITGVSARVPTVRPESMDLVRAAERLEALLTTENLGIMTGVLTDRDIELIKNIGSGLRVTEGGIQMSEEGARERLRQIRDTIEKKLSSARGRQRSQQETGQGGGSDIEALINKYAD